MSHLLQSLGMGESCLVPSNHEDGGREEATAEVFLSDHIYKTYFDLPMSRINRVLGTICCSFSKTSLKSERIFFLNLFSDIFYVVHLLPELAQAYIRLNDNPIIPHD